MTFPLWKIFSWFIESSWMRVTKTLIFTDTLAGKVKAYLKQFRMPLVWGKENMFHTVIPFSSLSTVFLPCSLFMFCMFYKLTSISFTITHSLQAVGHLWGAEVCHLIRLTSMMLVGFTYIIKTNDWEIYYT